MNVNLVVFVALSYGALLFAIAFLADRQARRGRHGWLTTPLVYTLSLSVYCTAWTFYGAVGYAARSGLEFLTIYLGPSLVLIGWWGLLRRLVAVGRRQGVTSIADLISARFGKSALLAGMVTALCALATTPYIALQLQSIAAALAVFAGSPEPDLAATALWSALGLAVFAVLFGTRNLDANERHHGVVMAIAVEAVVKLVALMAVGCFVIWGLAGGLGPMLAQISAAPIATDPQSGGRWIALTMVSAIAFITLPRMFQVLVVENANEAQLRRASWLFPAYLMTMSFFVVPIAVMGAQLLPASANPDLYVLTVPLAEGQGALAMLAFLGGFSSATSMVVVATIALATMLSNHVILPAWMRLAPAGAQVSGDIRRVVIIARRLAIAAVLALGYGYLRISGGGAALASIGLISFIGIAQIGPALLAGLFWGGATRLGVAAGLGAGMALWIWCLLLPSLGPAGWLSAELMAQGPWGIGWLRPQAMFGVTGMDPTLHVILLSLSANTLALLLVSLFSRQGAMERLSARDFTIAAPPSARRRREAGAASAADLMIMTQRVIGAREAQDFFTSEARAQGAGAELPDVTPDFLDRLERKMAGTIGAAAAHAMVAQMSGVAAVGVEDLFAMADEAAQILEYSARLEETSRAQERTAEALRDANAKLRALGAQKDAFLTQISHELRTPMTSILAFSDLLAEPDLEEANRQRFAATIQSEAERLTRLLDELLDLAVLESGQVRLRLSEVDLADLIRRAQGAAGAALGSLSVEIDPSLKGARAVTDPDRLAQVAINLMSNAAKYGPAVAPRLRICLMQAEKALHLDFIDNGEGISNLEQDIVFEKFSRLGDDRKAGSAGLGLAICREIMSALGGGITYLPDQPGGAFRVTLPRRH